MTDEDLPEDLAKRMAEMQDDESIDFESSKRQADGWFKVYVECPDCEVPMARTTVESRDLDIHTGRSYTRSEHRGVCPDCGAVATLIRVDKLVASFDHISRAFEPDPTIFAGMLRDIEKHCEEQGWDNVQLEAAELRDKLRGLDSAKVEYDCGECDYAGVMHCPMQTQDMPVVYECPACGEVDDHEVVDDERA